MKNSSLFWLVFAGVIVAGVTRPLLVKVPVVGPLIA